MNPEDIKQAELLRNEIENSVAVPFNPVKIVESALYDFLAYQVNSLKDNLEFQRELKSALRARIPEADFNDIRILLKQSEESTNTALNSSMSPFLSKINETSKKVEKSVEEDIFENSSKDTLQAFNEVYQLIQQVGKLSKEKKDTTPLKEALKESLE